MQVVDGDEGGHAHATAHHGLNDADGRMGECDEREGAAAQVAGDAQEPLFVVEIGGDGREGQHGQFLARSLLQSLAKAGKHIM